MPELDDACFTMNGLTRNVSRISICGPCITINPLVLPYPGAQGVARAMQEGNYLAAMLLQAVDPNQNILRLFYALSGMREVSNDDRLHPALPHSGAAANHFHICTDDESPVDAHRMQRICDEVAGENWLFGESGCQSIVAGLKDYDSSRFMSFMTGAMLNMTAQIMIVENSSSYSTENLFGFTIKEFKKRMMKHLQDNCADPSEIMQSSCELYAANIYPIGFMFAVAFVVIAIGMFTLPLCCSDKEESRSRLSK